MKVGSFVNLLSLIDINNLKSTRRMATGMSEIVQELLWKIEIDRVRPHVNLAMALYWHSSCQPVKLAFELRRKKLLEGLAW
jgi:hypothetical protein